MPDRPEPAPEPPSRLEDIHRSEQTMVQVRWAAVVFATVQVLAYDDVPYPPGFRAVALLLVAALGTANVAIWLLSRRVRTLSGARLLSVGAMTVDVLVASGFVWAYTFDQLSALWAVLFILPLEGAIRFGLAGALAAWAAATALYTVRELWGSREYDYPFLWNSVSFRMGIGFLIALVAGMMARSLLRQRAYLEDTLVEVRRTDALRSRLVATLAHDVRNPLTTIRGTLNTLARHGKRLDESTRDELVGSADHQAERLERLATDLLDLARLEAGRLDLHLEDTTVRDVVERGLSFADPDHGFEVKIQPDLTVHADAGRLEQVVVNLASNALRYGRPPPRGGGGRRARFHARAAVPGPRAGGPSGGEGHAVRALPVRGRPIIGGARPGHRQGPGRGPRRGRDLRAERSSGSGVPGVAPGGRPVVGGPGR
ncbi:MAG: sensor histidine kinase, partial [Actinomycetota bacterium]